MAQRRRFSAEYKREAVGSCAGNAAAQSLFGVLKRERVVSTALPDKSRHQGRYL